MFGKSRLKKLEDEVLSNREEIRRLKNDPGGVWKYVGDTDTPTGYSFIATKAVVEGIMDYLKLDVNIVPATKRSIHLVKRDNKPKKRKP